MLIDSPSYQFVRGLSTFERKFSEIIVLRNQQAGHGAGEVGRLYRCFTKLGKWGGMKADRNWGESQQGEPLGTLPGTMEVKALGHRC
jgi:hypothetical protein